MRSSPDTYRALPWDRAVPIAAYSTFLFFYHFSLTYTKTSGQKRILYTAYFLWVVFIILAPTNLFVKEMRLEDYGYAPVIGPLTPFLFIIYVGLMVGAIYTLVKAKKRATSYVEKNRMTYLAIAGLFPIIGGFLDVFSPLPPASMWGYLTFSLLCTIVILKYHLMDIQVIIRRGLVYIVISTIVAIPYVVILYFLHYTFKPKLEPWWIHGFIILLLAIVLRPLYSRAQDFVDRLFYRGRYDFLKALEDFSLETHNISDLSQLSSSLVKLIARALQSSRVYLLLPSSSGDFTVISCTSGDTSRLTLDSRSPLLRWLRTNKRLLYRRNLVIIPQLQSLTKKDMNVLQKTRAELLVPIMIKEGELAGLLILGEKLSQQPYSQEDEHLILAVVSRMATELENARLYDSEKTMRKELEKQDEQKTEFLHSVAHELKTPLTAIISSSEVLSSESSIPHSLRKKVINNIRRSSWSMDRRVTELLDLAKMQIGELRIEPEPLKMGSVITEVASKIRVLLEKKGQKLTLEIPDSLPKVNADRGKLEQVLFNLLSNANKFSPSGSDIILRVREVDRGIIVEVEDSAPAVTEAEKMKLFDPYYRGEDADKRGRFPGLGLGLAISKKLVELHQGEIWVKSKSGKGNTFAFSLPALDRRTKRNGKITLVTKRRV